MNNILVQFMTKDVEEWEKKRSFFSSRRMVLSEHPAGASGRKFENAKAFENECSAVRARTA